jgi:hypothetical protein
MPYGQALRTPKGGFLRKPRGLFVVFARRAAKPTRQKTGGWGAKQKPRVHIKLGVLFVFTEQKCFLAFLASLKPKTLWVLPLGFWRRALAFSSFKERKPEDNS